MRANTPEGSTLAIGTEALGHNFRFPSAKDSIKSRKINKEFSLRTGRFIIVQAPELDNKNPLQDEKETDKQKEERIINQFKIDFKNQLSQSPEILGLFVEFIDVRVVKLNSEEYVNAKKDLTGSALCEALEPKFINSIENIQKTFKHYFAHVNHINRFAKLRPMYHWFENWNTPNYQQPSSIESPKSTTQSDESFPRYSSPVFPLNAGGIALDLKLNPQTKMLLCDLFDINPIEREQVMADSNDAFLWNHAILNRGYNVRSSEGLRKFLKVVDRNSRRDPYKKLEELSKQVTKQMSVQHDLFLAKVHEEIANCLVDPLQFNEICKSFNSKEVRINTKDDLMKVLVEVGCIDSMESLRKFDEKLKGNDIFDQLRSVIAEAVSKYFGEPAYIWIKSVHSDAKVGSNQLYELMEEHFGSNLPKGLWIGRSSWYIAFPIDWKFKERILTLNYILSEDIKLNKPPFEATWIEFQTLEEMKLKCNEWFAEQLKREGKSPLDYEYFLEKISASNSAHQPKPINKINSDLLPSSTSVKDELSTLPRSDREALYSALGMKSYWGSNDEKGNPRLLTAIVDEGNWLLDDALLDFVRRIARKQELNKLFQALTIPCLLKLVAFKMDQDCKDELSKKFKLQREHPNFCQNICEKFMNSREALETFDKELKGGEIYDGMRFVIALALFLYYDCPVFVWIRVSTGNKSVNKVLSLAMLANLVQDSQDIPTELWLNQNVNLVAQFKWKWNLLFSSYPPISMDLYADGPERSPKLPEVPNFEQILNQCKSWYSDNWEKNHKSIPQPSFQTQIEAIFSPQLKSILPPPGSIDPIKTSGYLKPDIRDYLALLVFPDNHDAQQTFRVESAPKAFESLQQQTFFSNPQKFHLLIDTLRTIPGGPLFAEHLEKSL